MMHIPHSGAQAHEHEHVYLGAAHDANARRTRWVVAFTLLAMALELAAGVATGSMALLADGLHMATHAGALGIAAAAYGYARRHAADRRFSFGTGKVGDLAGFASAVVLGLFALGIGAESALRLFQPAAVAFGEAALVAVLGLAVNLACAAILGAGGHGHSHGAHRAAAHEHDHDHSPRHDHPDNNLRSAYLHVLADALTSVLAIIALLAGRYLGWGWMDPAMGIVGAVVIARWSHGLMRDTARVLLDVTDEAVAAQVREAVEACGGARIVDLHAWRVGPEGRAAIVSVQADSAAAAGAVRERLSAIPGISHLTYEARIG
ncbi:CDF family Co(II)/Ni(II) efflux transporter DmeF [Bordetella sp. 2513F-2]